MFRTLVAFDQEVPNESSRRTYHRRAGRDRPRDGPELTRLA
jgi:hypothetical protein